MATEVSVRTISTDAIVFYNTYSAARTAANSGDVISIYKNLTEQVVLKDGVDVYIDPGTVITYTSEGPTITDSGSTSICNITGGGIIKNGYSGSNKQSCIKISNSSSIVNVECFKLECEGENNASTEGAVVDVIDGSSFRLICNTVKSRYNTAIKMYVRNDFFLRINTVQSGNETDANPGAPVIITEAPGSIYINELRSYGHGSCLHHKAGRLAATINKILTLLPAVEPVSPSEPTILLDGGAEDQELVLYFDEIKNLFTEGDAVKITEGKATFIGRNIVCNQGLSMDFNDNIISAYVQCDEIISGTHGINIANSEEAIIIEANYIEGNSGNDGVVRSSSGSNYVLRNAKIKCVDETSSSVCIYIASVAQSIEIDNLILVTGNVSTGDTIRAESTATIKNLSLFVNKAINEDDITLIIGTGLIDPLEYNYKYIVDSSIF